MFALVKRKQHMGKTIRLHSKPKPIYKYTINEQLSHLPRSVKTMDVIAHLSDNGITRNEFYADREIPFGSDKSIPADRLQKYAIVFDVTIDELQNQPVKATSIRSQFMSKKKSKSLLS